MTDRHKGYIVHLSKDVREDDAEDLIQAISMIKGVSMITPLISGLKDEIAYSRGKREVLNDLQTFIIGKL